MLRVDANRPGTGEFTFLPVTGEAEGVVVVGLGQLGSAGTAMGIVTIEASDAGIKMFAPLKINPLLMVGF